MTRQRIVRYVSERYFEPREESTSTFLFRPTVLVRQVDRVECVSEEEAIDAFFAFLEAVGPNVVLVGVDEDTVGVLFFCFLFELLLGGCARPKVESKGQGKVVEACCGLHLVEAGPQTHKHETQVGKLYEFLRKLTVIF